ncbi:AAA family ATPase, partial [Acinetobacter sp. 99]
LYFDSIRYEEYIFIPNKINVITGDSGTGKTSIFSIIDYCLMASRSNIPHDIQKKVSWFAISLEINNKDWYIARKSPRGGVSGEIFFSDIGFYEKFSRNITVEELKQKFDEELKIKNSFSYPLDTTYLEKGFEISYRDFLLFNALTESIIGGKDRYFDTDFFGNENFDTRLEDLFQLAIGVNSLEG